MLYVVKLGFHTRSSLRADRRRPPPRIFNNYKNISGVVSGRVSQSVSFLKTTDMLCINLTKITANIEYLIHRTFNNNNNK